MKISRKNFNLLLCHLILSLLSCERSEDSQNTFAKRGDYEIRKTLLFEYISYSLDDNDSITFIVNNTQSEKFKLKTENSKLIIDSLLIYKDDNFSRVPYFYSTNGSYFIQFDAGFGRVKLFEFQKTGKTSLIKAKSDDYLFGACINLNHKYLVTIVTGFGREPGPMEVCRHDLSNPLKISKNLTLNSSIKSDNMHWINIFKNLED